MGHVKIKFLYRIRYSKEIVITRKFMDIKSILFISMD